MPSKKNIQDSARDRVARTRESFNNLRENVGKNIPTRKGMEKRLNATMEAFKRKTKKRSSSTSEELATGLEYEPRARIEDVPKSKATKTGNRVINQVKIPESIKRRAADLRAKMPKDRTEVWEKVKSTKESAKKVVSKKVEKMPKFSSLMSKKSTAAKGKKGNVTVAGARLQKGTFDQTSGQFTPQAALKLPPRPRTESSRRESSGRWSEPEIPGSKKKKI